MNVNYKLVGISSFCATAIGFAVATLIINSKNGYVGSMFFLPLFLLVIFVGFVLFVISIIGFSFDKKSLGICLLVSAFLLPSRFIASCLVAKFFQVGAYRQEPMIPFPVVDNTVILKDTIV